MTLQLQFYTGCLKLKLIYGRRASIHTCSRRGAHLTYDTRAMTVHLNLWSSVMTANATHLQAVLCDGSRQSQCHTIRIRFYYISTNYRNTYNAMIDDEISHSPDRTACMRRCLTFFNIIKLYNYVA